MVETDLVIAAVLMGRGRHWLKCGIAAVRWVKDSRLVPLHNAAEVLL